MISKTHFQSDATVLFKIAVVLLLVAPILCDNVAGQEKPTPQKVRRVKRVKRPTFGNGTGAQPNDPLFFRDVYAEAIIGPRPDANALAADSKVTSDDQATSVSAGRDSWKTLVDAAAIEDEVKAQQQAVSRLVTTPVVFQTKFGEVNQCFEMLSVLFAVIRQYDGDIRWSKHAPAAQMLFQKAAVSSRTGAATGFHFCKTRKEELQELVRGGSIVATDPAPETIDWSAAANRSPLMVRLESANENLKKYTANQNAFRGAGGDIDQEANMIAMMARVILLEGMPDAEEDDYVAFAQQMQSAAVELKSATQTGDFSRASAATNQIGQSCADCHADWR